MHRMVYAAGFGGLLLGTVVGAVGVTLYVDARQTVSRPAEVDLSGVVGRLDRVGEHVEAQRLLLERDSAAAAAAREAERAELERALKARNKMMGLD